MTLLKIFKAMLGKRVKALIRILGVVLLIFLDFLLFAQTNADDLIIKLESADEIEKPAIFNQLSEVHSEEASDKALQYAETALKVSRKNKDKRNEALALQNLCRGYLYNDIYDQALINGLAALDIFEQLNSPKDIAYILSTLGWIYYDIQNSDLALNYHQKVLDIYLQLGDVNNIAYANNSLGLVYSMKEEYGKALTYYSQSLKIARENGLKSREAAALSNLGMTYTSLKSYDLALSHLQKALELRKEKSSVLQTAEVWNQLGRVHLLTNEFVKSENCLEKARTLIAQSTSNTSKEKLMDNYEFRSELYSTKGDYKKAFNAFREYSDIRNNILSDEKTNRLSEMRLLYETEKKESEIELLEVRKKSDRLLLITSIVGFIAMLIISYLSYSKLKSKNIKERLESEKLKDKLDFKNNELTTFALHIAQRNDLLNKFVTSLSEIQKGANETTTQQLKKLTHQIEQSRLVNKDLEDFHLNVENEHKDFFYNLNNQFPELTENEKRLSAQLRLNLSNKDIAALNNISNKSVEMARYRLRKKLKLDSKVNLSEFFKKF